MIAFRNASPEAVPDDAAPMDDCMMLIRDVVDHLSQCCDHCQSADETAARHLLVSMRRDVHEIQRLCDRLDAVPANSSDSVAMAT